jgi:uncharacterized protein involved in response to NO
MTASGPEPALSATDRLRRNPFSLFFPLGAAAGVLGVGPWIFWTAGWPVDMVAFLHSTLLSQGFLACFVVGFLFTAFPRFSGAAPAAFHEIFLAFAGALALVVCVYLRWWAMAQAGFLLMLGVVPYFALRRIKSKTKDLPPSFLLLGFGLLHAALGAALLIKSQMAFADLSLFMIGRRMAGLGFLLCMALGITAKLAPFLTGYTDDPAGPEAAPWRKWAWPHGVAGVLIFASFWMEGMGPRAGDVVRAAVASAHLFLFARVGRVPKKRTATALFFWLSCLLVPAGLWLAFLFPDQRVAGWHLVFIGGFSLMIFSFGMLVVLSHTEQALLLNGRMTLLKIVGTLVLLAAGLRILADFIPSRVMELLHSAASLWTLASALWLWGVAAKLLKRPAAK